MKIHETAIIGPDVKIGAGTEVLPFTIIEGNTVIGENCVIGPGSRLIDMEIGDNVEVTYTVAQKSVIGDGSVIGPFANLRPGTKLGKNTKIGAYVETKNTVMGDGSKAPHLSYLGDAVIGEKVNIGCGTITVNYDGARKHATTIKDGAFVGCNANLVAPVVLGKNSFVAAGSTINRDVPDGALAIARCRQENKEGWKRPAKPAKG
jgi:bifunctional UDP-N-acetylglucosamine pyrophosphorylase/glucosamine-1-phosphate N-acetyltransferase